MGFIAATAGPAEPAARPAAKAADAESAERRVKDGAGACEGKRMARRLFLAGEGMWTQKMVSRLREPRCSTRLPAETGAPITKPKKNRVNEHFDEDNYQARKSTIDRNMIAWRCEQLILRR